MYVCLQKPANKLKVHTNGITYMAMETILVDYIVILENALGKVSFAMEIKIAMIPLMNLFVEVRKL